MRKTKAEKILEDLEWPAGLDPNTLYTRLHDDDDGTREGTISVQFHPSVGDAWVYITNPHPGALRFRDYLGGGRSLRTRNALVLLALAIKLDNEEKPDLE